MNIENFDEELKKSNILPVPFKSQFMFDCYLGQNFAKDILPDILNILKDENSKNYDDQLAGQLISGKQVQIKEEQYTPKINKLKDVIEDISLSYVRRWFELAFGSGTSHEGSFKGRVKLSEFWVNEQLPNDYNPLHCHTTKTTSGLSGVIYLQEPEQIDRGIGPYGDNSTNTAGKIQVLFGTNILPDINTFRLTEHFIFDPTPGRLILFPINQPHQVDPFRGKGSRISLAFNIAVMPGQKGVTPWADTMIDIVEQGK